MKSETLTYGNLLGRGRSPKAQGQEGRPEAASHAVVAAPHSHCSYAARCTPAPSRLQSRRRLRGCVVAMTLSRSVPL